MGTANEESGKCVPLGQCQFVSKFIGLCNSTEIVRKSYCGFDNETLVCCENPIPVSSYNEEINSVLDISVCGVSKETKRVHRGKVADIGEFPWLVGVEFKTKENNEDAGLRCGGALINKEYVLTAAHCIINREFNPVAVRLGELDITKDPDCQKFIANIECADPVQKVNITETIPHPYYCRILNYNDIGLIRLEKQVEFTDFVVPICLAHSNVPVVAEGIIMTVAGWGITEDGTTSNILLKIDVPVVSREQCNKKFRRLIGLNQMCAGGEEGKGTCQEDTGGPLMYEHDGKIYQHGSVSAGIGCALLGYPTVYAKVSDCLPWIANVVINYK